MIECRSTKMKREAKASRFFCASEKATDALPQRPALRAKLHIFMVLSLMFAARGKRFRDKREDLLPGGSAFFQPRKEIQKIVPHPWENVKFCRASSFPQPVIKHPAVSQGSLPPAAQDERLRKSLKISIRRREIGIVQGRTAAIGRDAADLIFVRFKVIAPRHTVKRIPITILPVGISRGRHIDKAGDTDDHRRQRKPALSCPQTGGQEQVRTEAIPDGDKISAPQYALTERRIGAEALVMHGG